VRKIVSKMTLIRQSPSIRSAGCVALQVRDKAESRFFVPRISAAYPVRSSQIGALCIWFLRAGYRG